MKRREKKLGGRIFSDKELLARAKQGTHKGYVRERKRFNKLRRHKRLYESQRRRNPLSYRVITTYLYGLIRAPVTRDLDTNL